MADATEDGNRRLREHLAHVLQQRDEALDGQSALRLELDALRFKLETAGLEAAPRELEALRWERDEYARRWRFSTQTVERLLAENGALRRELAAERRTWHSRAGRDVAALLGRLRGR